MLFINFIVSLVQRSVFVFKEFNFETNKNYLNCRYKFFNDGIHSFSLNISLEPFSTVTKILVYFKGKVPQSADDQSYQRELVQSVVDVEKISTGMPRNIVTKTVAENIFKSFDFELKFPFQKVRRIFNR